VHAETGREEASEAEAFGKMLVRRTARPSNPLGVPWYDSTDNITCKNILYRYLNA